MKSFAVVVVFACTFVGCNAEPLAYIDVDVKRKADFDLDVKKGSKEFKEWHVVKEFKKFKAVSPDKKMKALYGSANFNKQYLTVDKEEKAIKHFNKFKNILLTGTKDKHLVAADSNKVYINAKKEHKDGANLYSNVKDANILIYKDPKYGFLQSHFVDLTNDLSKEKDAIESHHKAYVDSSKAFGIKDVLKTKVKDVMGVKSTTTLGKGKDKHFKSVHHFENEAYVEHQLKYGPIEVAVEYKRDVDIAPYIDTKPGKGKKPIGLDADFIQNQVH